MSKHFLYLLLFIFTINSCATAQKGYSTNSGKAVKLFEKARVAPNKLDKTGRRPDYDSGIELLNQALKKDPNFTEAHDLISQFYIYTNDIEKSVYHQKELLRIHPNQDFNGTLFFSIAELQLATGEYEDAIVYANRVINYPRPSVSSELQNNALIIRDKATFAIHAIENPSAINPVNVGKGINTENNEYFPTITVDGKTLLFTREVPTKSGGPRGQEDFFTSELSTENVWTSALPMPSNINTPLNEGAPTLAPDGRSLVFVACSGNGDNRDYGPTKQGYGSCDLFYTKKLGDKWLNPINLPGYVNSSSWESQPSLSSDGKTMYFVKRIGRAADQNSDIFVTKKDEKGYWGKPERLPMHINTPYKEESVMIHPDGQTLYFSSNGHIGLGGTDLFMCRKQPDGTWSKPTNLGYPINTKGDENSLLVGPDGEVAFFASDRPGGFGGLDIYSFQLPENLRATKTTYFEGFVYDASNSSKLPIPGNFELIDIETGEQIIEAKADKLTGEFIVALPTNRQYALNVTYPNYAFYSKSFNMKLEENQEAFRMDIPLYPIAVAETKITLENVFFDLNKTSLRKESFVELNKLVSFLDNNPSIKIEIGGHTDTRGDAEDNQKLSEGRASSVYRYLLENGISTQRLTFKGYGETQPIINDTEIDALTTSDEKEKAHQTNRRTEYKIIK
ncbi:MAG: OmpA family protein [Lishizhenia sp.]